MPVGRIGSLSLSRLISGSNLISPNMHARDLLYLNALAREYNTEEKVFQTLQRCEEHGINAIVLKNHNFERYRFQQRSNSVFRETKVVMRFLVLFP